MANEKKDIEVFKKMLKRFRTNVYCHGRNFEEYSKTEKGEKWNEKNFVLTNQIIDLLTKVFEKGVTQSAINKFLKLDAQFE